MTEETLRNAKAEAKRFIEKVAKLEMQYKRDHHNESINFLLMCGSKESGAVRRASMDLTRALADLRR